MTFLLLQLSDPHLLANPQGWFRGVQPKIRFDQGLKSALSQIGRSPNLILISGDLCQDETWGGYCQLRDLLIPLGIPIALLPGNHDNPQLLRSCLGRFAHIAPSLISLEGWLLLLLDSHLPGEIDGWISPVQIRWAELVLQEKTENLLMAMHHPPEDQRDGDGLMANLVLSKSAKLVLLGHIHQHRRQVVAGTTLLGCPSSLVQFVPTQICPLGFPDRAGGRLIELEPDGSWRETLLRWSN